MLIVNIHHSAAENDIVFINIVGPLVAFILCYYFVKRKINHESEISTEGIRFAAKIGAYAFGILFFIAFLFGTYKGIKFYFD